MTPESSPNRPRELETEGLLFELQGWLSRYAVSAQRAEHVAGLISDFLSSPTVQEAMSHGRFGITAQMKAPYPPYVGVYYITRGKPRSPRSEESRQRVLRLSREFRQRVKSQISVNPALYLGLARAPADKDVGEVLETVARSHSAEVLGILASKPGLEVPPESQ